jgi:hypothetical protein
MGWASLDRLRGVSPKADRILHAREPVTLRM